MFVKFSSIRTERLADPSVQGSNEPLVVAFHTFT